MQQGVRHASKRLHEADVCSASDYTAKFISCLAQFIYSNESLVRASTQCTDAHVPSVKLTQIVWSWRALLAMEKKNKCQTLITDNL